MDIYIYLHISGQITIIFKLKFNWFWEDSPAKPHCRVTLAEVAIVCQIYHINIIIPKPFTIHSFPSANQKCRGSGSWSLPLSGGSYSWWCRNPAPVEMVNICKYHIIWRGFIHVRWCSPDFFLATLLFRNNWWFHMKIPVSWWHSSTNFLEKCTDTLQTNDTLERHANTKHEWFGKGITTRI